MSRSVWIIGAFSTPFGKAPQTSYKAFTRQAYEGVLGDARMEDGRDIDGAWFGNAAMGAVGQSSIRGQVCFIPLVRDGGFPERVPVVNVENACATGSAAIQGARNSILAGESRIALALGVEKLTDPKASGPPSLGGGSDMLDPEEMIAYFAALAERSGKTFAPGLGRSLFMDTYAMQAAFHMARWGTTQAQIAAAAAKTHNFGALNPLAQYRFETTVEQVLADRPVSYPLTRSMCAPIGDGAAAVLLCSDDVLAGLDPEVRDRAVRVRSIGVSGGKYRDPEEPSLSRFAADRAYRAAGLKAADIDVAEVHDATSFSELYQSEMLGFCPEGGGGRFIEDGGGALDSPVAINTSGGLVSKGHPIGATGCSMTCELVTQLRGEAGPRQKPGARLGLAENGGGAIGFDEAVCYVSILEKP
ncbi:MAG: thiolase family protein [Pseudomonadota bacterium]